MIIFTGLVNVICAYYCQRLAFYQARGNLENDADYFIYYLYDN